MTLLLLGICGNAWTNTPFPNDPIHLTANPTERSLMVFSRLPGAVGNHEYFDWLVSELALDSLGKAHLNELVRSITSLEYATRVVPGTVRMTRIGSNEIWLLGAMVNRVEVILLGDVTTFRKSQESAILNLGISNHLNALLKWCDEHNISPGDVREIRKALTMPSKSLAKHSGMPYSAKQSGTTISRHEEERPIPCVVFCAIFAVVTILLWLIVRMNRQHS